VEIPMLFETGASSTAVLLALDRLSESLDLAWLCSQGGELCCGHLQHLAGFKDLAYGDVVGPAHQADARREILADAFRIDPADERAPSDATRCLHQVSRSQDPQCFPDGAPADAETS